MTKRKPVEAPTDPDLCVTLDQKYAYQRRLRERFEAASECPSDLPWIIPPKDFSETPWFCDPWGIDPRIHIERELRRLKRNSE